MVTGQTTTVGLIAALLAATPVAAQSLPRADVTVVRHLLQMEEALAQAVNRSARSVEQQVPSVVPGLVLFAGPTQVRGFLLDGYGVFFDVEYPLLRRSILWSMQMLEMNLETELRRLRSRLQDDLPALERAFREIEPVPGGGAPVAPVGLGAPVPERPRAETARDVTRAAPAGDPTVDPGRLYEDALSRALVETVLRAGGPLAALLAADAWVTVAARDPRGLRGRDTTVRVAAADVVAFAEGRLTLDEARGRVEVAPF